MAVIEWNQPSKSHLEGEWEKKVSLKKLDKEKKIEKKMKPNLDLELQRETTSKKAAKVDAVNSGNSRKNKVKLKR